MIYVFTKSGSRVRIIGSAQPYMGQPCVAVARVDTGKEMVVPSSALVPEGDYPKFVAGLVQRIRGLGRIEDSIAGDVEAALWAANQPDLAWTVVDGHNVNPAVVEEIASILEKFVPPQVEP